MFPEHEKSFLMPARMPEDVYEQIKNLPGMEERFKITKALFDDLSALLISNGVKVDWEKSIFRTKSESRIREKISRRGSTEPQRDIYGVRFVTDDERRKWLSEIIQSAYPLTPKTLANGKLTVRDYRDEFIRGQHIERSNPHMSPLYNALHINFVFGREGSDIFDIGEVQIMTHKELEVYEETWKAYPNGKQS